MGKKADAKYFVGQDEIDFPLDTQFKIGLKGETYIVLPPYAYIGGSGPGIEIQLGDDEWLMLQSGTVLENVTVRTNDADT